MKKKDLIHIIAQGESETVEFKQSFNKSVYRAVSAFSNSKGGSIIVGVKDSGETIGVNITNESVQKWINEIKQNTNPQVVPFIEVVEVDSKQIVFITVIEYPIKPVGYKEKYYKRVLNSNHQMSLTEVANEHLRIINSSWDYYPDPNHSLENISLEKVEKYTKDF